MKATDKKLTKLQKVKKKAAKLLDCGRNKIWLDPTEPARISEGRTEEQVQKMIDDGLVVQRPNIGQSRGRVRQYRLEKYYGRHTGFGKRRGTRNARFSDRKIWMLRIKAIRKELKQLREEGRIDRTFYRVLYLKAKGGCFKSRKMMREHIVMEELKRKKEEMIMAQMGNK